MRNVGALAARTSLMKREVNTTTARVERGVIIRGSVYR